MTDNQFNSVSGYCSICGLKSYEFCDGERCCLGMCHGGDLLLVPLAPQASLRLVPKVSHMEKSPCAGLSMFRLCWQPTQYFKQGHEGGMQGLSLPSSRPIFCLLLLLSVWC